MDGLTIVNPDLEQQVARTIPGMAHWAGSGPAGSSCGQCSYFITVSRGLGSSTRCNKYSQMMNGRVGAKKLPPETAACKYFEQKPRT